MFHDYSKIMIKAGDGGNGMVAFRREKYVPMGGPAGGDGGRGGSIYMRGCATLHTLIDFKYRRHYKAERGENGMSKNCFGAAGEDMYLDVPLGTVVRDEKGNMIADITCDGQVVLVAKGGRGGRGNTRFVTRADSAPHIAENGEPGEEKTLILELKVLADVGLIGMPNAGKSTLISRVTAAQPKIANYPFTTLTPNLGVAYPIPGEDGFVIADLPGLIEGVSSGIGLGHRFLRHAERTRVMVHVLDMSEYSDRDPLKDFEIINEELRLYKQNFMARPQLIAANKMDTEGSAERLEQLREYIGDRYPIYPISALTGEGVQELLMAVYNTLLTAPPIEEEAPPQEDVRVTVVRDEAPFVIEEEEPGVWRVTGKRIENLVQLTNLDNEDALMRMQRTIVQMGLEDALRAKGVEPGDTVCILDVEFEYAE